MPKYVIQVQVVVDSTDEDHLSDRVENILIDLRERGYSRCQATTRKLDEEAKVEKV